MHRGGAASEQRGQIEVGADRLADRGRRLRLRQLQQPARRVFGRRILTVAGERPLEVAAQLLARVRPGGPLVGHEGLQHRQRAGLGAAPPVVDRADDGRGEAGGARVEETRDLQLGADPPFDPAEHLQEVAIAVADRRGGVRRADVGRLARRRLERIVGGRLDGAAQAGGAPLVDDGGQERPRAARSSIASTSVASAARRASAWRPSPAARSCAPRTGCTTASGIT